MINFLNTYWRIIAVLCATVTLLITIVKLIANSYAIRKITDNELKHITADIDTLKKEEKEFKNEMRKEIHQIGLGMGRIERKIIRLEAVQEERNKKDR